MTMTPAKKVILVLAISAVIVLAGYAMLATYTSGDFDDGAPTADIDIKIKQTDGPEYVMEDPIEIKPVPLLDKMTLNPTNHPMTAFQADVPPVDPDSYYSITFIPTVNTLGNVPENYQTTVTITGGNSRIDYPITGITGPLVYSKSALWPQPTAEGSAQTEYNVPEEITVPGFWGATLPGTEQYTIGIMGEFIDGSVFAITIVSEAAPGSYGMTEATIEISVGAGGDLFVEITGISTSVG